MRELGKRIKVLEKHTGTKNNVVFILDVIGTNEKELNRKIEEIRQKNPKAVFIIDDISD